MNTNEEQKAPFLRLPYWIRCAFILWLLFGTFPIFAQMFGFRYLPSPDWVSQVRIPATVAGVIFAALLTWGVIIGIKTNDQFKGKLKNILTILFAPFFGFMIGSIAITAGGPMLGAIIYGVESEMPYTVTKFKAYGDRKCRRPITLDGLPLLFEKLCGYPEEFGSSLEIGEQILITGHGSGKGIFAQSARRID